MGKLKKETCNVCGDKATTWIEINNQKDKSLKVGFCAKHKAEATKVTKMLAKVGVKEL